VLVSGFVALTLSPMMCSLLLQARGEAFVDLQRRRAVLQRDDQRLPRALARDAAARR
jgi:multidrug efflux pump subunit AcrB